jgi:hypothetical protein
MDRGEAAALAGVLGEMCPDADVEIAADSDGVHGTLSGHAKGVSMSRHHVIESTYLSITDDGPVMRFLMNGHL